MPPKVQPSGTPIIPQALLETKEIAGNFEYAIGTAPEHGDKRKWIWQNGGKDYKNDNPTLRTGVEDKLVKKYAREQSEKNDREGKYTPSRQDLIDFWHFLRRNKTAEDWRAMRQEGQQLLTDIINQLNAVSSQTMADFGRDLNFFGKRGSAGLSIEADEKFGELINEITAQRGTVRKKIDEAIDRATKLIEEDADAIIGLLQNDGDVDKLGEPARNLLIRMYENDRKNLLEGGLERDAEQDIRSERLGAAGGVRAGHSRTVQQGLYDITRAWEQLKAATTKADEERFINEIKAIEERIFPLLDPLTRTVKGRFEPLPVGREQADNYALAKVQQIRENKDADGLRNAIIGIDATWFDPDWDTASRLSEIMLANWVAESAIERLTESGVEEVEEPVIDPATGAPATDPATGLPLTTKTPIAFDGKTEFIEHFANAGNIQTPEEARKKNVELLEVSYNILKERVDELNKEKTQKEREIKVLKRLATQAKTHYGKTDEYIGKTTSGGGNKNQNQVNPLNDANRTYLSYIEREEKAKQELIDIKEKIKSATKEKNDIYDETAKTGTLAKARRAANAKTRPEEQTKYEATVKEIKEAQYNDLLRRLRAFVNQKEYRKSLHAFIKPDRDEWNLLHELTGIDLEVEFSVDEDKKKEPTGIALQPVWTGNVPRKDGKTTFKGSRAAVNTWAAMPEMKSRISNVVVEKMLEKPERFQDLIDIKNEADKGALDPKNHKRKVILAYGFSPNPDVGGGVSRPDYGIDPAVLERLQEKYKLTIDELLEKWYDDPEIQYELDVRPEDVEELQMTHMARAYLTRVKNFPAENGWLYDVVSIASSDPRNLTTQLSKMVAAGKKINSQTRREKPFRNLNDNSNEWAYNVVKDGTALATHGEPTTELDVWYRDENLTEKAKAPKTFVDRYAASMLSRLELYFRHAKLGAPSAIKFSGKATSEQKEKIGAYFMAYTEYVQRLMEHVERIQRNGAGKTDAEQLESLLKIHDGAMAHLTYDIVDRNRPFDTNGEIRLTITNPHLERYVKTHATVNGRLNSQTTDRRKRFVEVEIDESTWDDPVPNYDAPDIYDAATGEWVKPPIYEIDPTTGAPRLNAAGEPIPMRAIDFAQQELDESIDRYARHMTFKLMLGEQALNQLPSDTKNSDRKIAERVAGTYVHIKMTEELKNLEMMKDARLGHDENGVTKDFFRLAKGWLDMSFPVQFLRWLNIHSVIPTPNLANVLLRGISKRDLGTIVDDMNDLDSDRQKGNFERTKQAGMVEWYLAARLAQAVHTGNQRGLLGIFKPEVSALITGEDAQKPGLQLDKTTKTLWNILARSMMKMEDADATDRTIDSEKVIAQKVKKELGVNIYKLFDRVIKAKIPDDQYIDTKGNRHNYRPAGSRVPVHELSRGDEVRSTIQETPRRLRRYVLECLHPRNRIGGRWGGFLFNSRGPWQRLHGNAALRRPKGSFSDRPYNK